MSETTDLIKRLRAWGLSQTEITRRTGIPQPRLSRWESGEAPAGADDALRLATLVRELGATEDTGPTAIAAACALCGSHVLPSDWDRLKTAPEIEPSAAPEPREPANAPASAFLRGGRRDEDHSDSGFGALDDEGDALDDHVAAIGRLTGDRPKRDDGEAA